MEKDDLRKLISRNQAGSGFKGTTLGDSSGTGIVVKSGGRGFKGRKPRKPGEEEKRERNTTLRGSYTADPAPRLTGQQLRKAETRTTKDLQRAASDLDSQAFLGRISVKNAAKIKAGLLGDASQAETRRFGDRLSADTSNKDRDFSNSNKQADRQQNLRLQQNKGLFEIDMQNQRLADAEAESALDRSLEERITDSKLGVDKYGIDSRAGTANANRLENARQYDSSLAEDSRQFNTSLKEKSRQFDTTDRRSRDELALGAKQSGESLSLDWYRALSKANENSPVMSEINEGLAKDRFTKPVTKNAIAPVEKSSKQPAELNPYQTTGNRSLGDLENQKSSLKKQLESKGLSARQRNMLQRRLSQLNR